MNEASEKALADAYSRKVESDDARFQERLKRQERYLVVYQRALDQNNIAMALAALQCADKIAYSSEG